MLSSFFYRSNNLNVFWPWIFRWKTYFHLKRLLTIVNKGSSLTVVNVFKHTIFLKHDPSLIVTILNFICCKLFFVLFLWIHSLLITKDYRPWSYNKLKLKFFFVFVDIHIFFGFNYSFFCLPTSCPA